MTPERVDPFVFNRACRAVLEFCWGQWEKRNVIAEFCVCGAQAVGKIKPESAAVKIREMFWSAHAGPGHGPCDRATAQRAAAKAEREAFKEKACD